MAEYETPGIWKKKEQYLDIQRTITVRYKVPLSSYSGHSGEMAKSYEEARDTVDKVEEIFIMVSEPTTASRHDAQAQFSELIVIED